MYVGKNWSLSYFYVPIILSTLVYFFLVFIKSISRNIESVVFLFLDKKMIKHLNFDPMPSFISRRDEVSTTCSFSFSNLWGSKMLMSSWKT